MEAQQQQRIPARKRKGRDGAAGGSPDAASGGGNRLLAGYLAHEFLTAGTVLGERLAAGSTPEEGGGGRYEAVAALVHGGGARVPGVVNPAQLAAWVRR